MGTPTSVLNVLATLGRPDPSAPAGIDTGETTMTFTDDQIAKLARKILKDDETAAAKGLLALSSKSLSGEQAELVRVAVQFRLAQVTEAPAPEAKPVRGSRTTDAGTALAARVRTIAGPGERVNRAMRAKKLAGFDPTLTVADVEALSDGECMDLVSRPIKAGDTAVELLDAAATARAEAEAAALEEASV